LVCRCGSGDCGGVETALKINLLPFYHHSYRWRYI
jgi:hypothetical protein